MVPSFVVSTWVLSQILFANWWFSTLNKRNCHKDTRYISKPRLFTVLDVGIRELSVPTRCVGVQVGFSDIIANASVSSWPRERSNSFVAWSCSSVRTMLIRLPIRPISESMVSARTWRDTGELLCSNSSRDRLALITSLEIHKRKKHKIRQAWHWCAG